MKFIVESVGLSEAVQIVSPAIGKTGSDISTHFLFRVREGSVEILGYSGRVFASSFLVSCVLNEGEEGEAFTLEGKRLKLLISSLRSHNNDVTFESEKGDIKVTTPMGETLFSSLDPKTFPFWDSALNQTSNKTTLNRKKFASAITYCGKFVSDQVSKSPNICVVEYRKGVWYATDQVVLASVHGESDDCNFRVFSKDLNPLTSFLSSVSSYGDDVQVHLSDRLVAFKMVNSEDSPCFFGHSLYRHAFPNIGIDLDKDDHYMWNMDKSHLLDTIQFLNSGGKWDDPKINFKFKASPTEEDPKSGSLSLSVPSVSGSDISVDMVLNHSVSDESSVPFNNSGFFLSHPYLTKVIGCIPDEEIEMRINVKEDDRKGWSRFKWDQDNLTYHAILTWQVGS